MSVVLEKVTHKGRKVQVLQTIISAYHKAFTKLYYDLILDCES